MRVSQLIERADALFPNVFPFPMKVRWLYRLDKEIIGEFLSRYGDVPSLPEEEMQAPDRELVLAEEYSDIYTDFLIMKMELHSGNITGYVNAAALYNSAYLSFIQHYNRTHRVPGTRINIS